MSPVGPAVVSAVKVPDAGGVAEVVTAHSYPIAPVAAVQLSVALLAVIALAVRPVTGGHAGVKPTITTV